MKRAWLVRDHEDSTWQIRFVEPDSNWLYEEVKPIVYADLEEDGAPRINEEAT